MSFGLGPVVSLGIAVILAGGASGSCQIHTTLADGSTWVAILSWAPNGGSGCCAHSTHAVGPAPMFTRGNAGGA